MATDGPTPPDCPRDIFENGKPVLAMIGSSNAVERWVKAVAEKANARVDWHYSGGIAQVLHLGDEESRARVEAAVDELSAQLTQGGNPYIYRRFQPTDPGLYRGGVTSVPEGTIGAFYEGGRGSAYIVNMREE